MARREKGTDNIGAKVTIRFTGAAGGSLYTAENGKVVLRPGDTIERPLAGHWRVLVDSGDAEVVE